MEMMLAVGGVMVDWSILSGVRTEGANRGGVSSSSSSVGAVGCCVLICYFLPAPPSTIGDSVLLTHLPRH